MDIYVGYNGAPGTESSNTRGDGHGGKGVEAGAGGRAQGHASELRSPVAQVHLRSCAGRLWVTDWTWRERSPAGSADAPGGSSVSQEKGLWSWKGGPLAGFLADEEHSEV